METILIESKEPFSLQLLERILSQHWRVESSPGETLTVHGNKSRAYLHTDVESEQPGVYRLLLDYSEVDLAKMVLEIVANDQAVLVNNDFGTVLPGNEFVARCKSESGWDWRR